MGQFDIVFVAVESSKAKLKSGIESGIICLQGVPDHLVIFCSAENNELQRV